MKAKKSVAVLMSGGLDSTYLIYKNLLEGNTVYPIYIKIENNTEKIKLEEYVIDKLLERFRNKYSWDKLKDLHKVLSVDIKDRYCGLIFVQAPIWLTGILFITDLPVDEIQIGYVSGDDALSYLDDFKRIYNSYKSILHSKCPKLTFPLKKANKELMSGELPQEYKDLIFYCESPVLDDNAEGGELCTWCPSCKRYKYLGLDHIGILRQPKCADIKEPTFGNVRPYYYQTSLEFADDNNIMPGEVMPGKVYEEIEYRKA